METTQYNANQSTPVTPINTRPSQRRHLGRWLIAAVVLVVVGVASVLWTARQGSQGVLAAPVATVNITNGGFLPQTVHIKKGQSITWINQDAAPHQIMSNPFPDGEGLPGLNSTEPLTKGDSYTAHFDAAGTYPYHDSLNPAALNGVVIVE